MTTPAALAQLYRTLAARAAEAAASAAAHALAAPPLPLVQPARPLSPMEAAIAKLSEQPSHGLAKLPNELRLLIVEHLLGLGSSRTSRARLIALSKTCRWFYMACRPFIWDQVTYQPASYEREREHGRERDLRHLVKLQKATLSLPPPIRTLVVRSVGTDADALGFGSHLEHELDALAELLGRLGTSLKALTLDRVSLYPQHADLILRVFMTSIKLSHLRLEGIRSVNTGGLRFSVDEVGSMQHIKVLQLIKSDDDFLKLVPLCPNLHSLVVNPARIAARDVSVTMFKAVMPQLRQLALTSAGVANLGRDLVKLILRLADDEVELQLEQVILEGWTTLQPGDFADLVKALARLPRLRLLSLQGAGSLAAADLAVLVRAVPRLDTLSLVGGAGTSDVDWPSDLSDYLRELGKFEALKSLLWDRRYPLVAAAAPAAPNPATRRNPHRTARDEGETIRRYERWAGQMGKACKALRHVFFLKGSTGGVATGFGFSLVEPHRHALAPHTTRSKVNLAYDDWMTLREV